MRAQTNLTIFGIFLALLMALVAFLKWLGFFGIILSGSFLFFYGGSMDVANALLLSSVDVSTYIPYRKVPNRSTYF